MKAIENLKTKPTAFLPPCLAKVNKIIPLIVTKDEIGSSFFINTYLNERFNRRDSKGKITVRSSLRLWSQ